jgi:hypothetical protein
VGIVDWKTKYQQITHQTLNLSGLNSLQTLLTASRDRVRVKIDLIEIGMGFAR